MSAPTCEKRPDSGRTCLASLADGWVTPSDLCPICTREFMSALDGIAGPLTWHQGFRERAGER